MTHQIFIFILLIHFLADFALQTDKQAKMKSQRIIYLLDHTMVYSATWFIATLMFLHPWNALLFAIITFFLHTITDFWTSRLAKKFFDKKDFHNGFVVVGFDQMLHYIQLYYTFKYFL